jgi:hypothetical protein
MSLGGFSEDPALDEGDCYAYARHMDDLGRENVVSCAKVARHRGQHYDDRLNVHWSYADERVSP